MQRRCIVTGETDSPAGLIRFAIDPDGGVVPDIAERLPGRGIWVGAQRDLLEQAIARGSFARGAKRAVRVPTDLVECTGRALAQYALELLGLLRRTGAVVTGFDQVRDLVNKSGAAVVLTAGDAAANALAKGTGFARDVPHVTWLTVDEMSLALGRGNVVHAGLSPASLTDRFLREALRLRGLRGASALTTSRQISDSVGSNRGAPSALISRPAGLP